MTASRQRHAPEGHPDIAAPTIGVLLVNLGTPAATDYWSIRRYLSQFLSDRRVVEIPAIAWQPILQGIILSVRPKKTGRAYEKIWDRTRNLSPLAANTMDLADALAPALADAGVTVDWAMRYGAPSIPDRLQAMKAAGCNRILLFPLYPQYSGATTATAVDAAGAALAKMRWQPALRIAPPYHDDPAFIAALAGSVRRQLASLDFAPDALVVSFHGMPRRTLDLGDPYHCQCQKTARLLREALDWPADRYFPCFQSRFGPAEWLQPYADTVLEQLPKDGMRKIAIVSPSFAVDCLETLEELAIAGRQTFIQAGGEAFAYLDCLNASQDAQTMMTTLIRRELAGWIE